MKELQILLHKVSIKKTVYIFFILATLLLLTPLSTSASTKATSNGTRKGNIGDTATYELTASPQYDNIHIFIKLTNGTSFQYIFTQGVKYISKLIAINKSTVGKTTVTNYFFKHVIELPNGSKYEMPETNKVLLSCTSPFYECSNFFSYSFPDAQSALNWYNTSSYLECSYTKTCTNGTDSAGTNDTFTYSFNDTFVHIGFKASELVQNVSTEWLFNWKTGWVQSFESKMDNRNYKDNSISTQFYRYELVDFKKGSGGSGPSGSSGNIDQSIFASYGLTSPGLTVLSVLPSLAVPVVLTLVKRKGLN